jgi:hypothetical protein
VWVALADDNLSVTNSIVGANTASASGGNGKNGGGGGEAEGGGAWIASDGPAMTITTSSIVSNAAVGNGGDGTAAGGSGGLVTGGGLLLGPSSSPVTLSALGLNGNTASANGGAGGGQGGEGSGGALRIANGKTVTLASLTMANNSTTANGAGGSAAGGGLWLFPVSTVVTVTNCTLSGNVSAAGETARAGGIGGDTGTVNLQNSILSGNTAAAGADCQGAAGTVVSLGNNIIGTVTGCNLTALGNDQVGVSPALGAFTDSGTPASGYFPLQPGSPAINAASGAACPAKDQLRQGRVGGCDIGAVELVPATSLVSALLPISRSAQVGGTTPTAFATIINTGNATAFNVGIAPGTQGPMPGVARAAGLATLNQAPATFHFQTTDPATNALTGTPDTGADIAPGGFQTYVLAFRPAAAFNPVELSFDYGGPNTSPVPPVEGLNTLLASASVSPIPDVIALAATVHANGIVDVPGAMGTGFFTVASVNLGAGGPITVRPDAGTTSPVPTLNVCQTNPATAACTSPLGPTVQTTINTNDTPTFAIFVTGNGAIPFNPATNRISVFFQDAGGAVRGATGVAVRTQ